MYSTCIHCRKPLGSNESIEALPIGRRLAFDASQGRLWVVCRACERWNLTPFEERWEAIEQGERAFRNTRVRANTDNIGLARLADGTELIRVGAPLRPEFAAWRYGDQFGRRRTKLITNTAVGVAAAGLTIAGAAWAGVSLAALLPISHVLSMYNLVNAVGRPQQALSLPDGGKFIPFGTARIIQRDSPEGWGVDIGHAGRWTADDPTRHSKTWWDLAKKQEGKNELGRLQLDGADALPLLRAQLPRVNKAGAAGRIVQDGVQLIEEAGGPERFGRWAAGKRREWAARATFGDTGDLNQIPHAARLAFEMAVHEDSEQRAMEGELAELERAWQDAEGVAHIADNLLTAPQLQQRLDALKDELR